MGMRSFANQFAKHFGILLDERYYTSVSHYYYHYYHYYHYKFKRRQTAALE